MQTDLAQLIWGNVLYAIEINGKNLVTTNSVHNEMISMNVIARYKYKIAYEMALVVRYRTVAHAGEPDQQARRGSQEELPRHVELGGEQTAVRTPQLIRE